MDALRGEKPQMTNSLQFECAGTLKTRAAGRRDIVVIEAVEGRHGHGEPTFLSGMLASYFLFYHLSLRGIHLFPPGGYAPLSEGVGEWARHLLLPWLTLSVAEVGVF